MRVTMTGVIQTGAHAEGVPQFPGADLTLAKGGSLIVEMRVLRDDGTPQDVSSGSVLLTVKRHSDATTTPLGFTKTGAVDPARKHLVRFAFEPTDTVGMEVRRYVYDVWWQDDTGARAQLVPLRAFLVAAASGRPAL